MFELLFYILNMLIRKLLYIHNFFNNNNTLGSFLVAYDALYFSYFYFFKWDFGYLYKSLYSERKWATLIRRE